MATLDISAPSPRVNFQLMSQYIGKRVTLVGKVDGVEGNTLRLKTSDDGMVTVSLQGAAPQVRRGGGRRGGSWCQQQRRSALAGPRAVC